MSESGVLDPGAAEIQDQEALSPFQVRQPRIADLRAAQIELLEGLQFREERQIGVANPTSLEIDDEFASKKLPRDLSPDLPDRVNGGLLRIVACKG